jgi:hypothetical protein
MPSLIVEIPRTVEPEALAGELADFWLSSFIARAWDERLALLVELDEQFREDLGDFDRYCAVMPHFIATMIERLGGDEIGCLTQAHIYSNSAHPSHRSMAGDWLARHHHAPAAAGH